MKIEKILNEAFSPSMPIWLRNYFLYNTPRRDNRYGGKRMPRDPKGSSDEYKSFRYSRNIGRDDDDLRAINILNKLGINFEKAKFNEISPPPKLNSPIFQDKDKLCISWLKSNYDQTLWLSGARSSAPHEKFTIDDGKEIALLYLNNKQYQTYCKGFCWLDMTDPDNFREQDQQKRAAVRAGSVERNPEMGKHAEKVAKRGWGSTNFDKSGYQRIPAVQKYADELAKRKQSGLANRLVETREALVKLRDDLKSVMDIVLETPTYGVKRGIRDGMQSFTNALDQFQSAAQYADQLSTTSNLSSTTEWLKNSLDYTNRYIKDAYQVIGQFIPTTIDYDVNDTTIYDDSDWTGF